MADEHAKLFDHLNQVKKKKVPASKYWESLSRRGRKSWSTFMIIRFLSMNHDLLPILDEFQPILHTMPDREACRLLTEILPEDHGFYKYISSDKKERSWPDLFIEALSSYWKISRSEVRDHLLLLEQTSQTQEIVDLAKKLGMQDQDLTKIKNCIVK